jgi:hypothetical protein
VARVVEDARGRSRPARRRGAPYKIELEASARRARQDRSRHRRTVPVPVHGAVPKDARAARGSRSRLHRGRTRACGRQADVARRTRTGARRDGSPGSPRDSPTIVEGPFPFGALAFGRSARRGPGAAGHSGLRSGPSRSGSFGPSRRAAGGRCDASPRRAASSPEGRVRGEGTRGSGAGRALPYSARRRGLRGDVGTSRTRAARRAGRRSRSVVRRLRGAAARPSDVRRCSARRRSSTRFAGARLKSPRRRADTIRRDSGRSPSVGVLFRVEPPPACSTAGFRDRTVEAPGLCTPRKKTPEIPSFIPFSFFSGVFFSAALSPSVASGARAPATSGEGVCARS